MDLRTLSDNEFADLVGRLDRVKATSPVEDLDGIQIKAYPHELERLIQATSTMGAIRSGNVSAKLAPKLLQEEDWRVDMAPLDNLVQRDI